MLSPSHLGHGGTPRFCACPGPVRSSRVGRCIDVVGAGLSVQTARVSAPQSGCTKNREYEQTDDQTMRASRARGGGLGEQVMRPGACVSIFR